MILFLALAFSPALVSSGLAALGPKRLVDLSKAGIAKAFPIEVPWSPGGVSEDGKVGFTRGGVGNPATYSLIKPKLIDQEYISSGAESENPLQVFVATMSQFHWITIPPVFPRAGGTGQIVGMAGWPTALVRSDTGRYYEAKHFYGARADGVGLVYFKKRGQRPNQFFLFPGGPLVSHQVVAARAKSATRWLLLVATRKLEPNFYNKPPLPITLESWVISPTGLTRIPKRYEPFPKLAGARIDGLPRLDAYTTEPATVDPSTGRAAFLPGLTNIHKPMDVLMWERGKGLRRIPGPGGRELDAFFSRGQLYAVGREAYRGTGKVEFYRLNPDGKTWRDFGPYDLVGKSWNDRYWLMREAPGGATKRFWLLDFGVGGA